MAPWVHHAGADRRDIGRAGHLALRNDIEARALDRWYGRNHGGLRQRSAGAGGGEQEEYRLDVHHRPFVLRLYVATDA